MAKKVGIPSLRGSGLRPPGGQSMPKVNKSRIQKPGKGIGVGGGQLANKVARKSNKHK